LPQDEDLRLMGIMAAAIGVEEVRNRAEEALRQSEAQLRYLSSQLLKAQETERKRIARQLHDSIGQSLSAIKFSIEEALERLDGDGRKEHFESLEAAVPLIQEVVDEVRRIQKNLRPSMLDDLGILATLAWFCRDFGTIYSGIRIEKQIEVKEGDIPEPLKTVIFRIVQEAMNNVAKHSKANLVELGLRRTAEGLELQIRDSGAGFDVQKALTARRPKGLGLSSMNERAELSGGILVVESQKGEGASVHAFWPNRLLDESASPESGE